jgi:hypothetical protein
MKKPQWRLALTIGRGADAPPALRGLPNILSIDR